MIISPTTLAERVSGDVFLPNAEGFETACAGFNLAAQHRPDLAVVAADVADVAAAVRYAAEADLAVRVHATGHGMGTPADGGLLLNTGALQQVSIDPGKRTAHVAAGTRWKDVISAAAPHGLAPLNGSSPTVGVVGYTLGGGMGPMARTFGFAADHVRRMEIITAAGDLLDVTPESEPELFWALRGGKCEIGVVTAIEFDLMPVAEYYGGAVYFSGADAPALLHTFAEWAPGLPDSTTASIALLRLPDIEPVPAPLRGTLSVHLRFVHVGDPAVGAQLIAPMRGVAEPLIDTVATTPYAQIGSVHADPEGPMPTRDDSTLLRELPPAAVDALLAAAGPDAPTPLIIVEIRHLGGAIARDPATPNAVGGRDAAFCVMAVGPYPPPLQGAVDAATAGLMSALHPWSTGTTLINFQGFATAPAAVAKAWPDRARARLSTVKSTWDPDGRFRFSYSPA